VSLGDEVEIEVDAYLDRIFEGKVTQIANSASNSATASLTSDQVTNFEVRINIDPDSYQDLITPSKPYPFRPGMSASVEINTQTVEDALSVPIQSVTTREAKIFGEHEQKELGDLEPEDLVEVVLAVQADTVDLRRVKTGIQDDTYIQILSGLEENEEVVAGPYTAISRELEEGDEVRKVSEEELYGMDE